MRPHKLENLNKLLSILSPHRAGQPSMYTPPRKLSNSGLHLFLSLTCTCSKHEPRPSKKTIQRHDTTYKRITINFMILKSVTWSHDLYILTDTVRSIQVNHITIWTCNSSTQHINNQTTDIYNNIGLITSQQQWLTWHRPITIPWSETDH